MLDDEVADTALGLMLMAVRQLPQAERYLRAGRWPKGAFPLTASLRGRTVGIVGLGRIGKAIATRVSAFGLDDRLPRPQSAGRRRLSLLSLARRDGQGLRTFSSSSRPAAPRRAISSTPKCSRRWGRTGCSINIARGSLVDEKALIEALRTGKILAAGLDVYENEPNVPAELIALANAVLLPHVGSASVKTRRAMAECVVANIFAWADGKPPLTPVPETPWRGRWGKGG